MIAPVAEMALGQNPWDYGNGLTKKGVKEQPEAYRCFKIYLELGRERSNKLTAEIAQVKQEKIKQLSSRYNWQERAAYYDAHMVELWGKQVRSEFENTHKKELMKFRKDQQRRATALGKVADLLIEVTSETLEDMIASGERIDPQQLAAVARTAGALSEAAMNTAAAALGVDDLMEAIAPEEQ